MKRGIIFLFVVIVSSTAFLYGDLPWPVYSMYEQHKISGTLGEIRSGGRLHEGVDIAERTYTDVIANISGTVYQKGGVSIGIEDQLFHYNYIHIWPNPNLKVGMQVVITDFLGDINNDNHLHFEYEDALHHPFNPLHFLTPFTDYLSPKIDKIEVVKDGTPGAGEPFPTDPETGLPLVSGKVDIKAWVWDYRVNESGGTYGLYNGKGCAPYKIGYAIYDELGNLVEGLISRIQFFQTHGYNSGYIYVPGSSHTPPPPEFIYWVTNNVNQNNSWDTYPLEDGKYRVDVVAYDVQEMYTIESIWVRVKNELPVVIFTDPADGSEDIDIYQVITIQFNKQMNRQLTIDAIEIRNKDKEHLVGIKKTEWQSNDETLIICAYDPEVETDTIGFDYCTNYQVTIEGTATDVDGQTLDGNYNGESEGSPEDDYVFQFRIRNPEFELELEPWLSKIKTGSYAEIKVLITNSEPREIGVLCFRRNGTLC